MVVYLLASVSVSSMLEQLRGVFDNRPDEELRDNIAFNKALQVYRGLLRVWPELKED